MYSQGSRNTRVGSSWAARGIVLHFYSFIALVESTVAVLVRTVRFMSHVNLRYESTRALQDGTTVNNTTHELISVTPLRARARL